MNLRDPKSPAWPIIYQVALLATTTICCLVLYNSGLVPKDAGLMAANALVTYLVYLIKKLMTDGTN